jgi:hypothetical protein
VVAFSAAQSEEAAAKVVVPLTRQRTAKRRGIRWISDGKRAYIALIRKVYRDPVRSGGRGRPRKLPTPGVGLTQMVKHRSGYRLVKVEVRHCFGAATLDPRTVRVERLNGVLRDRLNCITRKTHAFAKRKGTWDAAVGCASSRTTGSPRTAPCAKRRRTCRTLASTASARRRWPWD